MRSERKHTETAEGPPESADELLSGIRLLLAQERVASARQLVDEAARLHPDCEELRLIREALYPGAATTQTLPDSSHQRNMKWLSDHREQHRGKWVALLNGELVAADADLDVVMAAVRQLSSAHKPLIHHIRE